MDTVIKVLDSYWLYFLGIAPRLFFAILVLAFMLALGRYLGRLVSGILKNHTRGQTNRVFIGRLVTWAVATLGILLALSTMGLQGLAASLLATGGVVAIVAGFAFREIGENFLAGFFLAFSRPFELKDFIKTGDLTGTVAGIELRYVHIRTLDACDVFVPSAQIFREPLYNYTCDGLRRPDFTIGIAYHDDPAQVLLLLKQAVSMVPDVLSEPSPTIIIKDFASSCIEYQVFFWVDINSASRSLSTISNEVKIACWRTLSAARITFSTDVNAGIDIKSLPTSPNPPATGASHEPI